MKAQILFLAALLFAVLVAVFARQNVEPVDVSFLFWEFESSLALLILCSVLVGALLLEFFRLLQKTRAKINFRQVKKKGTAKVKVMSSHASGPVRQGKEQAGGDDDNRRKKKVED